LDFLSPRRDVYYGEGTRSLEHCGVLNVTVGIWSRRSEDQHEAWNCHSAFADRIGDSRVFHREQMGDSARDPDVPRCKPRQPSRPGRQHHRRRCACQSRGNPDPTYILSTREDHIAPWRSTYAATQIYGGDTTFVLGGSGHVGGVVNPVTSKKYGYWTNSALRCAPEEWLAEAQHTPGSWWVHWKSWLDSHAGDLVPGRQPGEHGPVIEDAPGSYVRRAS